MSYQEAIKDKKWWQKFFIFVGWFFMDDNGNPSMMRVLSLFNAVVGAIIGLKMMEYMDVTKVFDTDMLWLVIIFVGTGVLGKGIQKLAEKVLDKKL